MNDIVFNKKDSIERCIKQIRTYYQLPLNGAFEDDYLRQDAIAMNLQRACEQCIDLANHTIRVRKLGLPKETRDSFRLLATNHIIPQDLAAHLEGMVGFRNVLVHEYQQMDIKLMIDVIENRLGDLLLFVDLVMENFAKEADPPHP
jgi:uncharacterized protein YutE (UPF0331/DUF86 family)